MTFNELFMLSPLVSFGLLGLFSLAIGSLLNVFIYRLPLMLQSDWRSECCTLLNLPEPQHTNINLFFPRSFCPSCHTTIRFWQNIPIISYCLLRGQCYRCHQSISFKYPLVELLCLTLSLGAAWHFGFNLLLVFALLFIWALIVLSFIDIDTQFLPDSLTLGLLWLGLLANTHHLFTSLSTAVYSAAGAYLSLWVFMKLFYLITGKIGMGHGDFKLFAAFGAWFGWTLLPLILILSSLTGAIVGTIYLKLSKKTKDSPIPFGPFLCLGGLIALFYGQPILTWYMKQML